MKLEKKTTILLIAILVSAMFVVPVRAGVTTHLVLTVKPETIWVGIESTVFTVQRLDSENNPVTSGDLELFVGQMENYKGEYRAISGEAGVVSPALLSVTILDGSSTVDFWYYSETTEVFSCRVLNPPVGDITLFFLVTVEPAPDPLLMSISISPTSINFGTVPLGTIKPMTIEIHNTGEVDVIVTAQLFEDTTFYADCLWLIGSVTSFNEHIPIGGQYLYGIAVNVPRDYEIGHYTGTLVFWVEEDV